MGYAYYELPDGREAGYSVVATCDAEGCKKQINRGLGYLCGDNPDGHRSDEQWGCGLYFCEPHLVMHPCENPMCGVYTADEMNWCVLAKSHNDDEDPVHQDDLGQMFVFTA